MSPRTFVRVTLDYEPELDEKMRLEAADRGITKIENIRQRLRAPHPLKRSAPPKTGQKKENDRG